MTHTVETSEQEAGDPADLEARKRALIDAAAGISDGDVLPLLRRYFKHVAAEDVASWPAEALRDVALGHREFAMERPVGAPKVRVFTLTADHAHGRHAHTALEIVTDDMPFLLDSVSQELSRQGIGINLVVHPQLVVRRDLRGHLDAVLGTFDVEQAPSDTVVESWMHIEVARQDQAGEESLRAAIVRVLRDVRDVVEDWQRIRRHALEVAAGLAASPPPGADAADAAEVAEFVKWLADDHFTFVGYREYRLLDDPETGEPALGVVPGTGLGVLRGDKPRPRLLSTMPVEARARVREPRLLLITKANSRSTVHRPAYLDYIGIKTFDAAGRVTGERRFLGLFTSSAYVSSVRRIPLLRRKAEQVLERAGFAPHSHDGKNLLEILENHPRDEMFQTSVPELYETALGVLHLQERRQLRLFIRHDVYGRFVSCLVYLPRDRFNSRARARMREILRSAFGGVGVDDTLRVAESVLARVHFVVHLDGDTVAPVDRAELQRRLSEATRTWDDDFAEILEARVGDGGDRSLISRYTGAFPEAYKEDFAADVAVDDIEALEKLAGPDDLGLDLYEPPGAEPGEPRLKIYRLGPPVSLSNVLPLLQSMGVEVSDERPYGIERRDAGHAWIYDFGLVQGQIATDGDPRARHERFQDALAAAWRGAAEADGFQALVVRAGLAWRQVMVLRAYAKFLRQAGSRFSQEYVETALVSNAPIARMLVELFETRLSPSFAGDREVAQAEITSRIEKALDDVSSLDQDRIIRSYLGLITATVRTNYWQRDDSLPKPYLSLKFASERIFELPQPRPYFEIFVYSPRMEGVHLRFGPVARGGIRYSDRREDFRTEVLGLAKTQTVKNAVIVPVGSKGGFVVKRLPADQSREAQQAEVVECYRTLIRGLLDLTDNLVAVDGKREVAPPADTVRHDGDDTYLVVAADKGTATFSDIANDLSAAYQYWLGDAFASGGSAGYDHKEMGITARGAWESVKRHFRALGLNTQTTDFTCVGIGDMSGDVFGNGMLASEHARLVAAFDHRHVFVDPNPDAVTSFRERQRLFSLPRSSWADYDPALISPGGGVWPRTAKSVPISPEMAAALGISDDALAPADLIRAVLRAPVDLLFNGGIGTYVKARGESNADVGDRANDAVRIDGHELRCRVVGEGGNLGFTQLGRIEYALGGGRINTDAIDNSAGVDTSDHEVNIKILLDGAARSGRLDAAKRGALLASMTDEIAGLVLRDNYAQNLVLSCAQADAPSNLHVHAAYVDALEKGGHLVRELEHLPDAEAFAERKAAGLGLTRPELSVLLAYAKITLAQDIVASDIADDIFAQEALVDYFPSALREPFAADMAAHPLLRDIIATQLANQLVNYSGITFAARVAGETTASAADIVRAHTAARQVFGIDDIWSQIESLDDIVASETQTTLLLAVRQLLDQATRWFLANRRLPLDVPEAVASLASGVRDVLVRLRQSLRGGEAEAYDEVIEGFVSAGVPLRLARRVVALDDGLSAMSIVDIGARTGATLDEASDVYFALGEAVGISGMMSLIADLPRDSRWRTMARMSARDDLLAEHAALTTDVLVTTPSAEPPAERISLWQQANYAAVSRARAVVDDVLAADVADLAMLAVALREVRGLVRAAALPGR